MLLTDGAKTVHDLRLFFQINQRLQFRFDQFPVQPPLLADHDSFHVDTVLWPIGERFQNNQVFRRAGQQLHARREWMPACSLNHALLDWQAAQTNIEGNPFRSLQKQHPMFLSEISGRLVSRPEGGQ